MGEAKQKACIAPQEKALALVHERGNVVPIVVCYLPMRPRVTASACRSCPSVGHDILKFDKNLGMIMLAAAIPSRGYGPGRKVERCVCSIFSDER